MRTSPPAKRIGAAAGRHGPGRSAAWPVAAICALVLAGCGSGGAPSTGGAATGTTSPGAVSGTLTVLAAASLTDALGDVAAAFESDHPGVDVRLSFGGSSALARQLTEGAPGDVFAAAAPEPMADVVAAGLAGAPVVVATNTMTVVVPATNPGGVARLADLGAPGVTVALCKADVPCGAAAERLLSRNGVVVTPVTLEPDVRAVLGKVAAGEVDAGVVYATDVAAGGTKVRSVAIPPRQNVTTSYPAAVLSGAANQTAAAAFLAYLTSPPGRAILAAAGFGPP